MAKDYAKFVPAKPRSSRQKRWRLEIAFAFFLLILTVAGVVYYAKHNTTDLTAGNPKLEALIAKVSTFFQKEKKALEVKPTNSTLASATDNPAPAVQFDFYNELPNMQVAMATEDSSVMALKTATSTTNEKSSLPAVNTVTKEKPLPVEQEQVSVAVNKPALSQAVSVVKPQEISDMLTAEKENQTKQYYIFLGTFSNQQAASRMLAALNEVGFQAQIVKVKQGKQAVYRVQQGPYATIPLARLNQQRLQKRGIVSEIQKVT
jgi:cell division protein FtsN